MPESLLEKPMLSSASWSGGRHGIEDYLPWLLLLRNPDCWPDNYDEDMSEEEEFRMTEVG